MRAEPPQFGEECLLFSDCDALSACGRKLSRASARWLRAWVSVGNRELLQVALPLGPRSCPGG